VEVNINVDVGVPEVPHKKLEDNEDYCVSNEDILGYPLKIKVPKKVWKLKLTGDLTLIKRLETE